MEPLLLEYAHRSSLQALFEWQEGYAWHAVPASDFFSSSLSLSSLELSDTTIYEP